MRRGAATLLLGVVAWFATNSTAQPSIGVYLDASGTSQTVEVEDAFDGAYMWVLVQGLTEPLSYMEFGISVDPRLDLAFVEAIGSSPPCAVPAGPTWPSSYLCQEVGCGGEERIGLIFLQVLIFNAPEDASICVTAASPSLLDPPAPASRGCPTSIPVQINLASSPYGDGCATVNPVRVPVFVSSWGRLKQLY